MSDSTPNYPGETLKLCIKSSSQKFHGAARTINYLNKLRTRFFIRKVYGYKKDKFKRKYLEKYATKIHGTKGTGIANEYIMDVKSHELPRILTVIFFTDPSK